jgi:hypothetical protein
MLLRVNQLSARRGLPKQIFVLEKQDCINWLWYLIPKGSGGTVRR